MNLDQYCLTICYPGVMPVPYMDADPRILRAIAHPLRGALLYELYARGAANGTILAEATGKPLNSVCFHLGQLAKYGLIEHAPDLATDGRQRWWRPSATEGLRITKEAAASSPEGQAAFEVFQRHGVARWHAAIDRLFAEHDDDDAVRASNDVPMMLTDEEARQYAEELYAVMRKWLQHGQQTQPPEGHNRRTYLTLALTVPHQPE